MGAVWGNERGRGAIVTVFTEGAAMLTLFRNRLYVAVVAGHFGIDMLNSLGPVLLAVLATPFSLSNAQIGLALTMYTFIGALSQPFFGWLSDRLHHRASVLAGLGLLWTALCYAAVALSHTWMLMLPCFLLASLGSALFHPIGTARAATAQQSRSGSATAIFFFGGQVGLALGPTLGGALLGLGGRNGIIPLCIAAFLPAALLIVAPNTPTPHPVSHASAATARRSIGFATIAFVVLVALRSSIQASYTAFLPKFFADQGWSPAAYGLLSGTFMLAAAVGNIATGTIADRRGMRSATVLPLVLGVPAGLICLWAPTPVIAFVACALAGLLIGGQHSVLVVHAQQLLPARQGFAAGLILGFTFAAGGIGTWLGGLAADQVGLLTTLRVITMLGLPAALLALTLPNYARVASAAVSAKLPGAPGSDGALPQPIPPAHKG